MENKKLYRSSTDKKILGVAGGLAEYFNIDSTLIRIFFILSVFAGSLGLWIYLILGLVLKYNPEYVVNENVKNGKKRFLRAKDGKIFGVCKGIADYFDFDVSMVRILFALGALFGIGILFYIVAAIVTPVE